MTQDIDSLKIERGDTLITQGPIGSFKIRVYYRNDSSEQIIKPDSQRIWIAIETHQIEVEYWKNTAFSIGGISLVLLLLLVIAMSKLTKIWTQRK